MKCWAVHREVGFPLDPVQRTGSPGHLQHAATHAPSSQMPPRLPSRHSPVDAHVTVLLALFS